MILCSVGHQIPIIAGHRNGKRNQSHPRQIWLSKVERSSAENELEAETVWYIVSKTWRLSATVEIQFAADEGLINFSTVFIRRIIRNERNRKKWRRCDELVISLGNVPILALVPEA